MAGRISRLFGGGSGQTLPKVKPFVEFGSSGTAVWGGYVENKEKNQALAGSRRYTTASDIMANVSIVAAGLRYFLNMCAKPAWKVDPVDDTPAAKEAAEFADSVINGCHTSWSRIVRRSGMYRFHGFGINEWTAKRRDDGRIGIDDIESRPQHTIERWEVDERGTVIGVWQRAPQTGAELFLPRGKIIYLVDDMMTDSPEGLGWFRNLVDPAERLKQYLFLEGTGFERDLRGIPIARAPLAEINAAVARGELTGAQAQTLIADLTDFVKMQVRKSDTGFVLDSAPYRSVTDTGVQVASTPQWGIELVTGSATSAQEIGAAITRLTWDMARIMGVENMLTGSEGAGSLALSKDKSQNLYLTINATLKDMAEGFDRDVLGPVWALNGLPPELRPTLKTEDVAFRDVEQISATLRNLATAGAVLSPDDEAINDVRDLLGISRAPEMTLEMMGALPRGKQPAGLPGEQE